jgi:alpha-maltose-1-phosphate synthase
MRVAHVLRKYNPLEWGGTETAVKRLLEGLRSHGFDSVVFAPRISSSLNQNDSSLSAEKNFADPLREAGFSIRRFRAFLPVIGLPEQNRKQLISIGGNLMSLELIWSLPREPNISVIHTHTTNRLGAIALNAARIRRCPLVVTIHGGVLDLPAEVKQKLVEPLRGGFEWGKVFGWVLRSRKLLDNADAIVTCNRKEAALLGRKYPAKPILVQPHSVSLEQYQTNHRDAALNAFPRINNRKLFLSAGRIDPVKNQGWLVQQWPAVVKRHPTAMLILAGPCTDECYGKSVAKEIRNLGLSNDVLMTGGLAPDDPRLIGLFQTAEALLLPSLSETFGLVILEAWAAGRPVIATATSGVGDLVADGENGWLFDLTRPTEFHGAIDRAVTQPELAANLGRTGKKRVADHHNAHELACRIRNLYQWLTEEKRNEICSSSGR